MDDKIKQDIEMSKEEGVKYIQEQLVNGKLIMVEATKVTGWSFPRIRSRAITICKKLGGTFEKETRGIYIVRSGTGGL